MTDISSHTEPAAPPLRILLVEDDEFDVAVFGRAFHRGKIPCEIIRCRSGEEAQDGLRDVELEIDLLVTDHQLPGKSGFDFCLELVETYRAAGTEPPFAMVLLTGVGSEQMAIRALRAGISDYIVKDASQEYLELLPLVLPRVARRYRQRRRRALAARESTGGASVESAWAGGLGLSACADVVKQRGGRIWVDDGEDQAPTLHFSVPLARDEVAFWTAAGADLDPDPSSDEGSLFRDPSGVITGLSGPVRHVLIVHPNSVVTFVARRTAERLGCRVAEVASGAKAIEALDREPFDLVLMALEMPELGGLETARRIRRREGHANGRVSILALGAGDDAAERCREAGMDGTVATPVSVSGLKAAIESLN